MSSNFGTLEGSVCVKLRCANILNLGRFIDDLDDFAFSEEIAFQTDLLT